MKKCISLILLFFVIHFLNAQEARIENNIDSIYTKIDTMPTFPGGASALMKFISTKIKYPSEALKKNLQGKIIMNFYVDIDGSIKEPKIIKDPVGGGCAEEALRVIKLMPKWQPGIKDGKPVRVYFTFPIGFKLQ